MNQKAQASLEYLLTYGWALILVATIITVLVFVVGGPASTVTFSSSDQAKIMLKSGSVAGDGKVEVLAQNATGGAINVIGFFLGGDFADVDGTDDAGTNPDASLNDIVRTDISNSNPLSIGAGRTLTFKGITYVGPGDVDGLIEIVYNDFAGFQRRAIIRGNGKANANGTALTGTCQSITEAGLYYIENAPATATGDCINIEAGNVVLNCKGKTLKGNNTGTGVTSNKNLVTITNCVISDFWGGIYTVDEAQYNSINSSTISNTFVIGIAMHSSESTLSNNLVCGNNIDIYCSEGTTGSGNKATNFPTCSATDGVSLFNTSSC